MICVLTVVTPAPRERHDIFGDVKKVVTDEFVRQRYLEYVRIPHTDPLEFEFRWGQRADMEVSKVKLLEFIGQVRHCRLPGCVWSFVCV
uniref:MAGE domain-containing protein n=1 Tax=Hucho hucho TaxID=62062 RepID=A0A4W5KXU6_9TELE